MGNYNFLEKDIKMPTKSQYLEIRDRGNICVVHAHISRHPETRRDFSLSVIPKQHSGTLARAGLRVFIKGWKFSPMTNVQIYILLFFCRYTYSLCRLAV
jgi:hypothetical protein